MKRKVTSGLREGRRTRQEVIQLLDQMRRSGLTQRQFAERVGVGYSTLTYWLRRERGQAVPAPATGWVAVDLVKPTPPGLAASYQVEWPNGLRVRVSAGFEAAELRRLLEVVAPCSP